MKIKLSDLSTPKRYDVVIRYSTTSFPATKDYTDYHASLKRRFNITVHDYGVSRNRMSALIQDVTEKEKNRIIEALTNCQDKILREVRIYNAYEGQL